MYCCYSLKKKSHSYRYSRSKEQLQFLSFIFLLRFEDFLGFTTVHSVYIYFIFAILGFLTGSSRTTGLLSRPMRRTKCRVCEGERRWWTSAYRTSLWRLRCTYQTRSLSSSKWSHIRTGSPPRHTVHRRRVLVPTSRNNN